MKINWKLRLKNKTTLLSLIACLVAFIYQVLGILGVTTPISQEQIIQAAGVMLNLVFAIATVVDPTTSGVSDSEKALTYTEPK